jgi:hypothetical protein
MPVWASDLLNLGFAIFFGVFICLGIREACRAYWPVHKARLEAQTKQADEQAALAIATVKNQEALIDLTERNTQMNSANTQALATLAHSHSELHGNVKEVYRHLMRGCKCDADRTAREIGEPKGRTT